ncbi:hypothetical protein Tsp_11391 [Trichinella spiralis]|uniref:hypothetical protein n=1 Tax=Trichinella spiralis TaxID=6334 RepID=UPI0001EFE73C|nr:hypothetical protein Tsp_11391 [Trichinella spiralis]
MPAKLSNEKNVNRTKEQLSDLVLTLRHRRIAVEERIRQDKRNNDDLPEYRRNKQKSYTNANVQNQNVPFGSTRSRRSRFTNNCLISSNVFMRFRLIQNEVYNIYHIFFKQDSVVHEVENKPGVQFLFNHCSRYCNGCLMQMNDFYFAISCSSVAR